MNKPIIIEILIWCIILTAVFCAVIFGYSKVFVEPNLYNIQFKDIDGITKGSPVRYMGINIGHVRKLEPKDKHINVQIVITEKNIKIPNETLARVEFYGLGGSKSIELMPHDTDDSCGIVSAKTLRLHDIVMKSGDLADIMELIEKFVKGINKPKTQKMLEDISNIKSSKMDKMNSDLIDFEANITQKAKEIRKKQNDINEKIKSLNNITDNLNKFIKK